jgi:hypothetical protein
MSRAAVTRAKAFATLTVCIAIAACVSQSAIRTPDGWRVPEKWYRLVAVDPAGNLMGSGWQITSHTMQGDQLVRKATKQGEPSPDFKWETDQNAITIESLKVAPDDQGKAAAHFVETRRAALCTRDESGLLMTPIGMAYKDSSVYSSYKTLADENMTVDGIPSHLTIIHRAGGGPVSEKEYLIAALHKRDTDWTVMVVYEATPSTFESGVADARGLIQRIRYFPQGWAQGTAASSASAEPSSPTAPASSSSAK